MNNMHIISRSQHPHPSSNQQQRQNKTRLQLTQTQNYISNQQKYHYSTVSGPFYQPKQQKQTHNQKQRSFHSLQLKHSTSGQTNIHLLMKEQIDIAVAKYQEKMTKILKAQAQQLQRLSALIVHSNKVIKKQSQIIKSLRNHDQMSTSSKVSRTFINEQMRSTSKSPSKISLTQKLSAKKQKNSKQTSLSPFKGQIRQNDDIQAKVTRLKYGLDEIQNRLRINNSQNKQLFFKIYQLQQKMTSEIWRKLKNCQESLRVFLNNNENRVVQIQKIINTFNSKREIQNKLAVLAEQSKELRELIYNISQREFTYQSYQINKLKEQLQKLIEQVQYLEGQRKQMSLSNFRRQQSCLNEQSKQKYALKQAHSLNYSQHVYPKNNLVLAHQELDRSQFSSISQYAPKYIQYNREEDMVNRSQKWDQLEQNNSGLSAEDQFYYDDIETQLQIREEKLINLQNILKKQGYNFPVRVQIDQTGYLKQYKTGMYILDDADNGFQLSKDEVNELRQRKIIY